MRNYEIMYIVKATLNDEEHKKLVANFEEVLVSNGAKIVNVKAMGQRELAYEIKDQKNGSYYVVNIESADDKAIKEFDRLALINKDIVRHLITKTEI